MGISGTIINMKNLTPEEQKDVELRTKKFLEEYRALTEKYQVDFISYPEYIPNPNGEFMTRISNTLIDRKYLPVKSPLQSGGGILKED